MGSPYSWTVFQPGRICVSVQCPNASQWAIVSTLLSCHRSSDRFPDAASHTGSCQRHLFPHCDIIEKSIHGLHPDHVFRRRFAGILLQAQLSISELTCFQGYFSRDPIAANGTGCPGDGTCSGGLIAAGFQVSCATYGIPLTLVAEYSNNTESNDLYQVFVSTFTQGTDPDGHLDASTVLLNVTFRAQPELDSNLTARICNMTAATVQNPVMVNGNASTISLDPTTTMFDDKFVALYEVPALTDQGAQSELGGCAYALSGRFDSTASYGWGGAIAWEVETTGSVGPQFVNATVAQIFGGNVTYDDPTYYLLDQARQLMFITALAAANGSVIQTVDAEVVRNPTVYKSHYGFLALATATTVVAELLALSATGDSGFSAAA
jgi:hypothetical protein